MAEKKSFLMYLDNKEQFDMLTDEQAGKLIKAIYAFAETGNVPEISDGMVKMAFSFIAASLSRDAEKYREICKKRAENGKKGGRPKKGESSEKDDSQKSKKSKRFFEKAKKPDSDSVSVSDSGSVSESENDNESVCDSETQKNFTQTHTAPKAIPTVSEILEMARNFGYHWDETEAGRFIAYNMDKGRDGNWGYAMQRWEENRIRRSSRNCSKGRKALSDEEKKEMDEYLALVNRFFDDEQSDD